MPHDPITEPLRPDASRMWGLSSGQMLLVAGFIVAAAAAGLVGALQLQRVQDQAREAEVTRVTDERMRLLRSSTLRCLEVLHAMASFLEESPALTREGFRRFVRGPLERLPELQALEWIPHVAASERDDYEAAARRDGLDGFRVTELREGVVAPARARESYHPVFFVEPADNNLPAIGFDVSSDPERRHALQRALHTRAPAATAPLRLAQERAPHELGMLVFAPVFARDHTPRGFAVAVLRIQDFMRPALAQLVSDGFAVRVYDRERPEQVLLALGEPAPSELARLVQLEFAGRTLALSFVPTQRYLNEHKHHAPWLFAGAGLLLGLLVAAHVARSMRYTHEVERRGLERAAANQRLEAEVAIRKQAQEQAAAAREAQAQFLANVSHEIRTPLNAIIGYAQLLQRCDADQTLRREALSTIGHSGQHLLTLLDEVIDLTKIEAGYVQLRPCDFDLVALVRSVAAMLRPSCERKGLPLRVDVASAPTWVRGDEGKLRQVLINLVSNAVKFTERGEVRLRVEQSDGRVQFEVSDTGIGIEPAEQERVFATFYQADPSRAAGSAGLGLSISRRLVELLGGELSLCSTPGRGSTFRFAIELASPLAAESSHKAPQIRLVSGAECNALVVDDRKPNRDILQHMLAAMGCNVSCASSGQAALELAAERRFQVIFLDLLMPGLDGIDSARALRARDPNVKLIAFSASALDPQRARCHALGFDGFLPKPFRVHQLQACLRDLVGVPLCADSQHSSGNLPAAPYVPSALLRRIRAAVELYQVTRLRHALTELEGLGQREQAWAERLRMHARRYEMSELLMLLAQLEAATENAA